MFGILMTCVMAWCARGRTPEMLTDLLSGTGCRRGGTGGNLSPEPPATRLNTMISYRMQEGAIVGKRALGSENVKIIVSTPLFDLENYLHVERIARVEVEEKPSSRFGFQETTCVGSNLIVLAEQD